MGLNPRSFWKVANATQMSVIIDAEDYFRHARSAMLKARKRIMLIGWDFDARISLVHQGRADNEPATVGDFIYWLVKRTPSLEIFLLRWDVGALKTIIRGSNILTLAKWMAHSRIHTKLDSFHPAGASHHQKIVVIDDCLAFCGGIDMTNGRWDTRRHKDIEPGRMHPNGSAYKPWHDATSALQGPIAQALGELSRDRWVAAGGKPIDPVESITNCWPDRLAPDFRDIEVGIARTRPEMPDCPEVRRSKICSLRKSQSPRNRSMRRASILPLAELPRRLECSCKSQKALRSSSSILRPRKDGSNRSRWIRRGHGYSRRLSNSTSTIDCGCIIPIRAAVRPFMSTPR